MPIFAIANIKRILFTNSHSLWMCILGCTVFIFINCSPAIADSSEIISKFRPHKAVYDVKLADRDDRIGNIRSVTGRLVYSLDGDICAGFTTNFRFVLNFLTSRNEVLSDQQTTTFETGDGKSFQFANRVFTNENLEKEISGNATHEQDGILIKLKKPDQENLELDEAVFPTQHLAQIIKAGKEGQTFVRSMVYDGSDNGTEAFFTQSVIGKAKTNDDQESDLSALPSDIASMPFWPVSISYFKQLDHEQGEGIPFYRISFKLYANGISRDLKLFYDDFSLEADLRSVEVSNLDLPDSC